MCYKYQTFPLSILTISNMNFRSRIKSNFQRSKKWRAIQSQTQDVSLRVIIKQFCVGRRFAVESEKSSVMYIYTHHKEIHTLPLITSSFVLGYPLDVVNNWQTIWMSSLREHKGIAGDYIGQNYANARFFIHTRFFKVPRLHCMGKHTKKWERCT